MSGVIVKSLPSWVRVIKSLDSEDTLYERIKVSSGSEESISSDVSISEENHNH